MNAADIVGGALAKWSDAFARNDWDALTALYSRNSLLYDSATAALLRRRRQIVFHRSSAIVRRKGILR